MGDTKGSYLHPHSIIYGFVLASNLIHFKPNYLISIELSNLMYLVGMSRIVQMNMVPDSTFNGDEIKSPSHNPFVTSAEVQGASETAFKFVSNKRKLYLITIMEVI